MFGVCPEAGALLPGVHQIQCGVDGRFGKYNGIAGEGMTRMGLTDGRMRRPPGTIQGGVMPRPMGTAGRNQVPGLLRAYRLCAFGQEGVGNPKTFNQVTRHVIGMLQELHDRDPMEFLRRWHELEMCWTRMMARRPGGIRKHKAGKEVEEEEDFSWTGGRDAGEEGQEQVSARRLQGHDLQGEARAPDLPDGEGSSRVA